MTKYNKISNYSSNRLDEILQEIERFYYSDFWVNRFKRRLKEENICYLPLELDIILGTISELKNDTIFKTFEDSQGSKGVSNLGTMIALNTNIKDSERNLSHIKNVITHEFGHRQYNQNTFKLIVLLNKEIIGTPKPIEYLSKKDYKYFVDHNELRQRIIPIIKEMYDNNWTAVEAYNKSQNLEKDDIKEMFSKDYILYLLNNLL